MAYCCVPGCNHRHGNSCRMFAFPKDAATRWKWQLLVRRARSSQNKVSLFSPKRHTRLCSCHFKDRNKAHLPTIFPWNKDKVLTPIALKWRKRGRHAARKLDLDVEEQSHLGEKSFIEENSRRASGSPSFSSIERVNSEAAILHSPGGDSPQQKNNILDWSDNNSRVVASRDISSPYTANAEEAGQSTPKRSPTRESGKNKPLEEARQENALLRNRVLELERKLAEATTVVYAAENTILKSEVSRLKEELKRNRNVFLFRDIADKDILVSHFTGLPNRQTFYALLHLFDGIEIQYARGWKVTRLDREIQLFMTLMKLRRGSSNKDLATRFLVEESTVANIFLTWLMGLHHVVVRNLLLHIPSRKKNQRNLPHCFQEYPNTRIILDCTEIATANPTLLSNQSRMFRSYKHRITSKALVGIAPNGTVTFVSDLFAGNTTDRSVVIESGILSKLVPGDTVMADKGFNIADLMPDGVTINIPPFRDAPQFTAEQVEDTFKIATARIHVERAIARIKNFHILDFIPHFVAPYASKVFQVCCGLTNFMKPLLKHRDEEE